MNPPFGDQADMRHIEHAAHFLRPDGRLLSIMSPSFQFRSSKQAEGFRSLLSQSGRVKREIEAGAFRESGTMVRTVIVELDAARLPWNQESKTRHRAPQETDAANEGDAHRDRMRA